MNCRCFVFYDQYKAPQTHLQPELQLIFKYCIGIINKYYLLKLYNTSKRRTSDLLRCAAFLRRRTKPIHSIPYSVAQPLARGVITTTL